MLPCITIEYFVKIFIFGAMRHKMLFLGAQTFAASKYQRLYLLVQYDAVFSLVQVTPSTLETIFTVYSVPGESSIIPSVVENSYSKETLFRTVSDRYEPI